MGNKVSAGLKDPFESGGSQVEVVLLSGETESFKTPVTARTVMKTFPFHLVIHCSAVPAKSTSSRYGGAQRYRVSKTILKPQNHLRADENYLVVPKSSVTIKSIADSWVMFAFNKSAATKKVQPQRSVDRKTKILTCIRRVFAHILRISSPCLLLPDERNKSLSLRYNEPTKKSRKLSKSNENSKGSQDMKSKHSSSSEVDSNSLRSEDRRKLSTWNRLPSTYKKAPSLRSAGNGVAGPLGHSWQPSPDLFKGFLLPFPSVTTGSRAWKPGLSRIPESSSKGL